jgi:trans-aconitate methyltransferase
MIDSAADQQLSSVVDPASDPHINGEYLKKNPNWHVEYSPGKAAAILDLLGRRGLRPRTICEVGCGAGEVLRQLQMKMPPDCVFSGYDIAPAAIEMARQRQNAQLQFELADFVAAETPAFDLLLVLEVVDHVENYLQFLRQLKNRAEWKLFSFSLDVSAQSALRKSGFVKAREVFSHLHHFNKEIAVSTLSHAGYEIVDTFYGPNHADTRAAKLVRPLRALTFGIDQDLSVRLFGGRSLLVLTR